jgi:hypothetical protein
MKWKSCPRPGESLRRRRKRRYPGPEAQQQATVAIEWQGQQFTGNNQQVLLEQLEQQGIRVPYSCRAGSAAAAASGWKKGEVSALKKTRSPEMAPFSLQLCTENGATPGALNRLPQAVADRALRRLQPVVHDFNHIAQLHDAPGKGQTG